MSRLTNGCVVPQANPLHGVENPRLRFIAEANAKATPIAPQYRQSYWAPVHRVSYDAQDQAAVAAGETLTAAEFEAKKAEQAKPAAKVLFDTRHISHAPHFDQGVNEVEFTLEDMDFAPASDDSDVYRGTLIEESDHTTQDEADRQAANTVHADIVLLDAIDDIREALEAFSEQHEAALARRDDETAQRLVDRIMSAQRDMRELERQYAEGHKVEPAARLVIVEMSEPTNDLGLSDEDYKAYVEDMEAQARLDHDWFDFHEAGLSSVAPQELAESGMAGTSTYVYEA